MTIKAIEVSLIHKLADYYNEPAWIDISEDLLLLKRLHAEKLELSENGSIYSF